MRLLLFGVQVLIALIVLIFSIYMLINHNDECGKANGVYLPIVTSIVGLFLPSPITTKEPKPAPGDAGVQV